MVQLDSTRAETDDQTSVKLIEENTQRRSSNGNVLGRPHIASAVVIIGMNATLSEPEVAASKNRG